MPWREEQIYLHIPWCCEYYCRWREDENNHYLRKVKEQRSKAEVPFLNRSCGIFSVVSPRSESGHD